VAAPADRIVNVVSISPGPTRTNFAMPSGVLGVMQHTPMFKPASQAARGIAWAATAPELAGNPGALYMRGKQLSLKGAAVDPSLAARIWSISEQQTGVDPAARPSQPSQDRVPDPAAATSRDPDGPGS
jgi:hypothetical protein